MSRKPPNHYVTELPDGYELELRLLIEALGWGEGFYRGEMLAHLARAGRKAGAPAIEDILKVQTYAGFEADRLQREAMQQEAEPAQRPSFEIGAEIHRLAARIEELEREHERVARAEMEAAGHE
jgi:hypothetical protein